MKASRLLAAAALASCLSWPAAARAQYTAPGSSGYGIFGGGTAGASSSFGRTGGFSQGGFGGASQGFSGAGGFGRSATMGMGSGATFSPYLNLLRPGNAAVNYYALVRPQVQQNAINTQYATNFQQTDRLLLQQQQQARQGLDAGLASVDLTPAAKPAAPIAQADARRRAADNTADSEVRDWAGNKSESASGAKEARRREASLRQARELKALEAELAVNADASKATASPGAGAPPDRIPGTPYGYRPVNHYFPNQGTTNRLGGNR
jgi:hypothetical protein